MRLENIQERDWRSSAISFYDDRTGQSLDTGPSDFSPMFWLATAGNGNGRAPPVRRKSGVIAGIPLSYPVLIGALLTLAYLNQQNFVSYIWSFSR